MGKPSHERTIGDTQAMAVLRNIRTSPQKLNLVAEMIRGMPVDRALTQLTLSKRRVAGTVRKALQAAIANAENNHELDIDRLVVTEASVGKSFVMKRFRPRARGRVGRIKKPFANLRVVVTEKEEAA